MIKRYKLEFQRNKDGIRYDVKLLGYWVGEAFVEAEVYFCAASIEIMHRKIVAISEMHRKHLFTRMGKA